jgi:hypothetical protein
MERLDRIVAENLQVEVPMHLSVLRLRTEQGRLLLPEPGCKTGQYQEVHQGGKLPA